MPSAKSTPSKVDSSSSSSSVSSNPQQMLPRSPSSSSLRPTSAQKTPISTNHGFVLPRSSTQRIVTSSSSPPMKFNPVVVSNSLMLGQMDAMISTQPIVKNCCPQRVSSFCHSDTPPTSFFKCCVRFAEHAVLRYPWWGGGYSQKNEVGCTASLLKPHFRPKFKISLPNFRPKPKFEG